MTSNLAHQIHYLRRENNPHRRTAMTLSYLGKLKSIHTEDLRECQNLLRRLLTSSLAHRPASACPVIVGVAESGLLLSGLMHWLARHWYRNIGWICSTRRLIPGMRFTESHSHSPGHVLGARPMPATEFWFVEDEMTTGRTVLHLAIQLCLLAGVKYIRIFTLLDGRTPTQKARFDASLAYYGIHCDTRVAMYQRSGETPHEHFPIELGEKEGIEFIQSGVGWHFPHQRPALQMQQNTFVNFPTIPAGTLLIVGEAIDLGMGLMHANSALSLQHITLSPWEIDDLNVRSRLQIGDHYYLYNYTELRGPIYIVSDPLDIEIACETQYILSSKGFDAQLLDLDIESVTPS